MVGKGLGCWWTMPTTRRTRTGSTADPWMAVPSMRTRPSTRAPGMSSSVRFMARSIVDLPHPEGPMKAVTVRGSIVMLTSCTAVSTP